jgi:hypothetical protein
LAQVAPKKPCTQAPWWRNKEPAKQGAQANSQAPRLRDMRHLMGPKPNIRVTSRKVDGYAVSTSLASMGRRAFMSRWTMPKGLA